jgi:hypothetical protein
MGLIWLLLGLFILPHLWILARGTDYEHWNRARWDSAGLAPDPATTPDAVVQVYAARTWGWKGVFAVHSWLAMKPAGAASYERYEVVGWGVGRGASAVRRNMRTVDGYWAGNPPELLLDRRGPAAEALIEDLRAAIAAYPYQSAYRTWPGPNSNSFIAHLGRAVPALGLRLPPTAVGKDFLGLTSLFGATPSGSGYQLSLFGLLGLSIGRVEGLELHFMGLTLGIDPLGAALNLPGIGRIGLFTPRPLQAGLPAAEISPDARRPS